MIVPLTLDSRCLVNTTLTLAKDYIPFYTVLITTDAIYREV